MADVIAATIVARNYLAQARVLARSYEEHHPEFEFATLLVDGRDVDRATSGIGRVILPSDLGLDEVTLHTMQVIYDVTELSTALKPSLLTFLLRDHAVAIYFDPDIRIYAPLDDLFLAARAHEIALTPHTVEPMPRDGRTLTEQSIMQAGIFNLGFIGVGRGSESFLDWWHERLKTDAISDVGNGLFTDQRWIDWVPALFTHTILRDQGLNVAYWNIHERPLSRTPTTYMAGPAPIRFAHFSGYDPETPWILSKHTGANPRVLLSESVYLRELVSAYRAELIEFGHPELRRAPYGLAQLPNGFPLTHITRRVARDSLLGSTPFSPPPDGIKDPAAFSHWATDLSTMPVSPVRWAIWSSRVDLQLAFPDPFGADVEPFDGWCRRDPHARLLLGPVERFAKRKAPQAPPRPKRAFGWSVVAYANAELGVGEAGRRMADAVEATGVAMELVGTSLHSASRQNHSPRREIRTSVGFHNVVTCVNADVLPSVNARLGLDRLRGIHAGLWFWELEEFPAYYGKALSLVHEVWTASEFTRAAVQSATDKKVRLVRLPIELPTRPTDYTRHSLGLPEGKYVFLTNFDYLSVSERKNPIGTIRAYMSAFGPDDGAVLVVKSVNADQRAADAERVRAEGLGRADIVFLDHYATSAEMKALIELADCYVSLHRSEGYGLNLADAMAHGTPTIATAYSGNLDFMTSDTSRLIPYGIVEVGPNSGPYNPRAIWADPDLDAAAQAMRDLFERPEEGIELAVRARQYVAQTHSLEAAAESVRDLVLRLRRSA